MRRAIQRLFPAAVLAAALIAAGCGSSIRQAQGNRLAQADALFMRGCYSCLRKAFDSYDSLRLAGYQPAVTGPKAFETALLLAAREKELGMDALGWVAKAEALQSAAGAEARDAGAEARDAGAKAPAYIAIVKSLRWATGRYDRDQQADTAPIGPVLDALEKWDAALGPPASRSLTATYLMAAARCAFTPAREFETLTAERLAPAHAAAPLMQYALGSCRPELRAHLDALSNDPDFHESTFQRGRLRLFAGGATVHLDARILLEEARKAMPEAIAATYLLAGVYSALQEYELCAEAYDDVVTRGGAKRESMLNRTVCLTHALKRPEAIRSATDIIDTPGILRGEAFFWRAWNQYHAKNLNDARTDVEASKKLYIDAEVFALSGFIAYDQDQKPYAYTEFGEAFTRSSSNYCVAAFYQGLIDSQREQWTPAAMRYEQATLCYSRSVRQIERELRNVEALNPDEHPTRQKRIDNLKAALDAEKLQLARSAYNTAYSFGQSGAAAKGIPFAQQASTAHKEMEKLANELLDILRKSGRPDL